MLRLVLATFFPLQLSIQMRARNIADATALRPLPRAAAGRGRPGARSPLPAPASDENAACSSSNPPAAGGRKTRSAHPPCPRHRVAAVAGLEFEQRNQPRADTDAAQFDRFGRPGRRRRRRFPDQDVPGLPSLPGSFRTPRLGIERPLQPPHGLVRAAQAHALAPADRRVARIAGPEFLVESRGNRRRRHPARQKLPQRRRMFRRPIVRLHASVRLSARHAIPNF